MLLYRMYNIVLVVLVSKVLLCVVGLLVCEEERLAAKGIGSEVVYTSGLVYIS